jgi:guanine deaminase
VGLATDTGGGSSFSMLRTMAAAYEIAQLRGTALHPPSCCGSPPAPRPARWGWTRRSAISRRASRPTSWSSTSPPRPPSPSAHARAEDIWQALFHTIMMGDDRAIAATYVAGRRIDA